MKLLFTWFACLFLACGAIAADARVYELRTYTAEPGKRADLIARLEGASPLFEKHGMTRVVFWTPTDDADAVQNTVVYILSHKDRETARASWKAFLDDPDWVALRDRNEANGKVITKVQSVFLAATDYSPEILTKSSKPAGVFELRTYTAGEGKLAELDERFRQHTMKLFEKHGMVNGGYFHPLDADKGGGTTLVYWLAHDSRDAATASWKAFGSDPEWVKVKTESEQDGKLAVNVKSLFLRPLPYSPLK